MNALGKEQRSSLEGAWVVNTRSPRQARELDVLLEQRRAHPLSYPCIDIAPALDPAPLDRALRRATEGAFDWLVFTSANAVEAVEARLGGLGIPPEQMAASARGRRWAGDGSGARRQVGNRRRPVPRGVSGGGPGRATRGSAGAEGCWSPRPSGRARLSSAFLLANGVEVEAVTAYRTVLGSGGVDVPRLLREGRVDAVVFASPSAVDNMAVRFERENGDWDDLTKGVYRLHRSGHLGRGRAARIEGGRAAPRSHDRRIWWTASSGIIETANESESGYREQGPQHSDEQQSTSMPGASPGSGPPAPPALFARHADPGQGDQPPGFRPHLSALRPHRDRGQEAHRLDARPVPVVSRHRGRGGAQRPPNWACRRSSSSASRSSRTVAAAAISTRTGLFPPPSGP